ncbi:MAG: DUF393 domain-containing protein [Pedobacter sp.]|nr:MAG: DUF393 domain-containing protein [Pedobacter sp.]
MQHSVILFDGICNLCNQIVLFVIRHDKRDRFRFAKLQGTYAKSHLPSENTADPRPDSVILLADGKVYTESTAVLKIAYRMGGFWSLLYGFIIIPAFIRNAVYRWIAKRRYQIWGRREHCMIPTPELNSKFI